MRRSNPSIEWVLLRRISLRHWKRAPVQSLLLLLILSFGVAVFFSIRLANRAAIDSFQNFTDLLSEESDWMVTAPVGTLDEGALTRAREALGALDVRMIPVVESTGARPGQGAREEIGSGETYSLLGVDLIAALGWMGAEDGEKRWFRQEGSDRIAGGESFWASWRDPRSVFITTALAKREQIKSGDLFPLIIQDKIIELRVAGIIPEKRGMPEPPRTLLVMDLPALQSLAGKEGRLDRIEFRVEPGAGADSVRALAHTRLTEAGRDRWVVGTPSDRRASAAMMTRAFRFNLMLLSLIALVVGLYLIYQALDGAVLRRREEMAVLRSLGVEPRTLSKIWLLEAAVLGVLGGFLGLGLGWAGATLSVRVIGRTVNALYYATSVETVRLDATELGLALCLSVGASLIAGWVPSRIAATIPPAQLLGRVTALSSWWTSARRLSLAVGMALVGLLLVMSPPVRWADGTRFPFAGYLAAVFWVAAAALVSGLLLPLSASLLAPLGRLSVSIRLALSHLRHSSSRHRIATGSLVCAVAMTGGMAILVESFDGTMRGWIERTFQADLYVSSDGAQSASSQNRISEPTWRAVLAHPGVAEANPVQVVEIPLEVGRPLLVGADLAFVQRHTRMAWIEAPPSNDIYNPTLNGALALVSESFSDRYRVHRGDVVSLPFPNGKRPITVAGVFAEYGNERGSIWISREVLSRQWENTSVANLILVLKSGYSPETVRSELRAQHPGLAAFTQSHLRKEILRIFRQTFAITYALEGIGVVVAVAGVAVTLASILLERGAEFATLRSLGMARGEMAWNTAWEGGLVAAPGVVVGAVLSLALGWLLIFVVNKQTFGWTLQYQIPLLQLSVLGALVLMVSMAVAYGIGWWGSTLPADREE